MKLTSHLSRSLRPLSPFNFDATFHKPDHFPSGDNTWEPGVRRQTFRFKNTPLGVIFTNTGSLDTPTIKVDIFSAQALPKTLVDQFIDELIYRYNLDLNLHDFYNRFLDNPIVGPLTKTLRGMRPGHQDSLYEYLVIGVMLQNCTVRRSIAMMQILFEKYGIQLDFAGESLWCFWEPGALVDVAESELRALKIGYRAKSLKRIDTAFGASTVDELTLRQKDRDTQKEALLKLYGVGPATVWYLLFDVFHHYDHFDHISPWEQKIYSKLFFNRDPEDPVPVEKLIKYFEKYHPYQQLAVHYIWEDLWWKRRHEHLPWLEKLIRL